MGNIEVKEDNKSFMDKIKDLGIGGLAILLLGVLAQLLFPWWSIAIVAFYVGFWVHDSPQKSMAYGTAAVTLLWTIYAGWQSSANSGIMSGAISNLFGGKISGTQLIFFTGLLGGIVGGLAAMTGTLLRDLFKKEEEIVA
jgi:hypothetical protein